MSTAQSTSIPAATAAATTTTPRPTLTTPTTPTTPDPATNLAPTPTAAQLDHADPLAKTRELFELPHGTYFVGNSLGALPRSAREYAGIEFDRWATLGVEGHFTSGLAWKDYHELVTHQLASLVGALAHEVVAMNSLTVNLHLLMVSFYRPTPTRHKILIEAHAFPSDHFAVESQIQQRGFNPADSLVTITPRPGDATLHPEDILATIAELGDSLALVLLPGVQYYTGQVLPIAAITEAAHTVGAIAGFDLAHAAGNIVLELHNDNVDFAAWCTYKYLNSGPGAVAAAFVHERHCTDRSIPKFHGWWGTSKATRFAMSTEFDAIPTAESWQLSNAPVFSLSTLRASLDVFDAAGGISVLRSKTERQIEFFDRRLRESLTGRIENITPVALGERGCQYALRVINGNGKQTYEALMKQRMLCDWREPDVIRVAPVPLYNSFAEIDRFVDILDEILQ